MDKPPAGRILVVDDQPNMCWVLSKLLSERGHEVRIAYSGMEALAALGSFAALPCQVAVVDFRLPDLDGIALITKLRERSPNVLAILMTSYGSSTLRQRALDAELFAYLDKPFSNDLMISTIEEAIRSSLAGGVSHTSGKAARTRFPGRALDTP
jgi:DNA-binding NtrC family response regulator